MRVVALWATASVWRFVLFFTLRLRARGGPGGARSWWTSQNFRTLRDVEPSGGSVQVVQVGIRRPAEKEQDHERSWESCP